MKYQSRQLGATLLELMISLTIGLFIIAGVIQLFAGTRTTYNNQERLANLQENGRFALIFLQRSLRKAGFPKVCPAGENCPVTAFTNTPSNGTCPLIAAPVANCGSPADTTTATTTATCNGANSDPDQIAVCYEGKTDCLGQDGSGGVSGVVTDFFFINTDAATGVRRLMCRGYYNGTANANGQAQPLADGIESLQIQYGEDMTGDGYADRYVRANEVSNWNAVVAVRVAVLASTRSNDAATSSAAIGVVYGDTSSDVQTYQVLEQQLTNTAKTRARVFTSTIEVRNRTP